MEETSEAKVKEGEVESTKSEEGEQEGPRRDDVGEIVESNTEEEDKDSHRVNNKKKK